MRGDLSAFEYEIGNSSSVSKDFEINKYGWTPLHAACYFGHIHIVKYIVNELDGDVNKRNENGWNSLIFAVMGAHIDVIDFLLFETCVDISIKDN